MGAAQTDKVFFDGGGRYTLARWFDGAASGDGGGRRLPDHEGRWVLARLLGAGRDVEIGDAYRSLLPDAARVQDPTDVYGMREALLEAAERGDVLVFELRLAGAFRRLETADEAPPPAPAPKEVTTWISIELVDDQDPPQPVTFVSYRIELPDGSTRSGMLDGFGKARLDGIDPGTCKVSFPAFDGRDWAPA
jgi:hypothetical protein